MCHEIKAFVSLFLTRGHLCIYSLESDLQPVISILC